MGKNGFTIFVLGLMITLNTAAFLAAAVRLPGGLSLIKLPSEDLNIEETLISDNEEYAVVFDAGSTGTRVHVFRFNARNLELLPIGLDFEFYNKSTPGLSAYANDPSAAADSLKLLLSQAEAIVPTDLRLQTPVTLGATAGLRLLSGDTAERILQAVRDFFKTRNSLKFKPEWVSVIDGFQEGSYMWVTANYLLETLGKPYTETVGVIDLGGASVQMAYAISEETAAEASSSGIGKDLVQWNLKGTKYNLYAHSYLKYGLDAARAQIFARHGDRGNPCVTNGYKGTYTYSGVVYNVSSSPEGATMNECRKLVKKVFNINAKCPYKSCTFDGVWNGGGGDGQKNIYAATSFYYTAVAAKIVDRKNLSTSVSVNTYLYVATFEACTANVDNIKSRFPLLRDQDMPFLCMDLIYEYSLLVDGFGMRSRRVNVVRKMEYKGAEFEAAWPLGCALDVLSPPQSKLALYSNK